jgi:hypothetical protein
MEINNPSGILQFFSNNMFKTYNVNWDGNCAYYCVQLFIEWKYSLGHSDNNAVVSVAAFCQQFRQHLQNVGIDYYSTYLTRLDSQQILTQVYDPTIPRPDSQQILTQVYDPTIPNIMDYYNFVKSDSVLPEHQWGTDDYLQIIAHWFGIQYVVIFSNDYITIADLCGDDDNHGKAPIKLYVNSDDTQMTFIDMLLSMPQNDTLFLYHTGNHYMWVKVEECLLPQVILKSHPELLCGNGKTTLLVKKPKNSQGDNNNEKSHKESPAKNKSPATKSPVKQCNCCMSVNKQCRFAVTINPMLHLFLVDM